LSEKISASSPNHEDPVAEQEQDERDSSLTLKGGMGLNLGPFKGAQAFFSEVRTEFKKISWPTRQQVLTETAVVIVVVAFLTVLITGMDWVFSQISNRFFV
jgi:preprotein translocase subunit SecE